MKIKCVLVLDVQRSLLKCICCDNMSLWAIAITQNACLNVDEEIAMFMSLHCEQCNEEATNITALNRHMRAEHNVRGYVRCCNKQFSKHGLLVEHIRAHLNPACYKSENCSRVFPDHESMRNHFLMKHQKDEDKTFACSQCPSKFVTVYLLQRHKVFSTGVLLSAHIKEQCLCDTCGKVVCNTAAFQRHILRHKNCLSESKELCACNICQKVSTSQQDMLAQCSRIRIIRTPLIAVAKIKQ
uniref:C2H2-type domain-containing protein n=1 Tax=Glossina palpalis gambiensis TaxID=67801 RepID=A0A1B0B1W0_9MUSC